ncbi:hypothetical protein BJ912DRAFT_976902 [Pholiota molesta]|nr:hypothetical protein BJ912DRAFT_976902 [Pholiota molesta]
MAIVPSRYLLLWVSLVQFIAFLTGAYGFIPAFPTNNTAALVSDVYNATNATDASVLSARWFAPGSFNTSISYSVAGSNSSGISTGVLVHFSEKNVNQTTPATTTPWIAFVSCDFNSTAGSQMDDIFDLAHSKGAISAVLYTVYSVACILNPEYLASSKYPHPIDVFSTQGLASSRLLESLFSQLPIAGQLDHTTLLTYDSLQLNNSANDIEQSIKAGGPLSPGYLLTTLEARNGTSNNMSTVNVTQPAGSNSTKVDSSEGTSVYEGQGTRMLAGLLLGFLVIYTF